jgi:hypothetical protein
MRLGSLPRENGLLEVPRNDIPHAHQYLILPSRSRKRYSDNLSVWRFSWRFEVKENIERHRVDVDGLSLGVFGRRSGSCLRQCCRIVIVCVRALGYCGALHDTNLQTALRIVRQASINPTEVAMAAWMNFPGDLLIAIVYAAVVPCVLFLMLVVLRVLVTNLWTAIGADGIFVMLGFDVLPPAHQIDLSKIIGSPVVNDHFHEIFVFMIVAGVFLALTSLLIEKLQRNVNRSRKYDCARKRNFNLLLLVASFAPPLMFLSANLFVLMAK